MIPEGKIIELIKKYRAESEKAWCDFEKYHTYDARGYSVACGNFTHDLEELLKSNKEGG